ncbi:hypothetical protein Sjap_016101 [Stephania japonica]|uniref:Uncharacterized protein n=1 Tax=Stephania japonica TaxID=461633 RepID=A0AAP0IKD9_9MAGN
MQGGSIMAMSPSFNSYSSSRFAEIAVKVSREFREQREELGLDELDTDFQAERFKEDEIYEEVEEFCVVGEKLHGNGGSEEAIGLQESVKEREEGDDDEEEENEEDEEDKEEEDFEFSVVCRDADESLSITADEIFSNGQIRPIYPLFDRTLLFKDGDGEESMESKMSGAGAVRIPLAKLLIEERDPVASSSSSEADELEAVPAGTYCVWTPKSAQSTPDRCKKSNSTGSSKRWRFRDFLLRSNSDGKDTFVFLAPTVPKPKKIDEKREKTEKPTTSSTTTTTTNSNSNSINSSKSPTKLRRREVEGEGSRRRSVGARDPLREEQSNEGRRPPAVVPAVQARSGRIVRQCERVE